MGPQPSPAQTAELFRSRLDELLNMRHPLIRLAALIDWAEIERNFSMSFTSGRWRLGWWRACCTCSTPLRRRTKRW